MLHDATRDAFSLKEAAVLSGLAEDKVRREIEHKVIEPPAVPAGAARRLIFREPEILYLALINAVSETVELTRPARMAVYRILCDSAPYQPGGSPTYDAGTIGLRESIGGSPLLPGNDAQREWARSIERAWTTAVNPYLIVDWKRIMDDIAPRMALYRNGRSRVERDDAVLGGEPVFAGTRLAVRHVGGMRLKGEPAARIVEDYPYLTPDDVEFAALFAAANPPVGRPRSAAGTTPK